MNHLSVHIVCQMSQIKDTYNIIARERENVVTTSLCVEWFISVKIEKLPFYHVV